MPVTLDDIDKTSLDLHFIKAMVDTLSWIDGTRNLDSLKSQQEEKEADCYTLTRDKLSRMGDYFYQVRGGICILEEFCFHEVDRGKSNESMQNVANLLRMVKEKLVPIERLLGK